MLSTHSTKELHPHRALRAHLSYAFSPIGKTGHLLVLNSGPGIQMRLGCRFSSWAYWLSLWITVCEGILARSLFFIVI